MIGKVLKPIPGTGYSVGATAEFKQERFDEYFELGYVEPVKSQPETATAGAKENAAVKAGKPGRK